MRIGLIDGRVRTTHPDLADAHVESLVPQDDGRASMPDDAASRHGTSVAGILVARRGSGAPAICPGATLVVRPVFPQHSHTVPPDALASAITETADAGARVLNLSLTLAPHASDARGALIEALEYSARRGVIVVAAAGNHGAIGGSVITRHRSVIPVIAYDLQGHPSATSNLGSAIGRHGVGATGAGILSLESGGGLRPFEGTSAAAAIVTGAIALLWSEFPQAAPTDLMLAITRSASRPASVVPPLVDAWRAYEALRARHYG
ncbi:S8 family serine peptidase [Streptomyces sp. 15-116A]|uniref:S8 family peptidase n=1 Tax=Streptomyces sp. 15-116A TaxID=2259035 RepID=UPI0021B4B987|nr:S8 family serine peptidase [Streptomyces sp. 15-116A]MCT7355992.1 S8 family serine peptidase [Streptomyces sp. 15-116A]